MAENSKIEWTTHTANIWWGCTKVHEGCDNCYAETLANRWGSNVWGNDNPRRLIKSFFQDLNNFQSVAKKTGEIHRVFVGSMMDIFEKPMPLVNSKGEILPETTDYHRQHFFQNISDGIYPNLIFLLLTKRPGNINKYIPENWKQNPPENVMFGTSPVNMETMKTLIPQLLKVNGKRFLSIEPQLGEISLRWALWHDYKNKFKLEQRDGKTVRVKNQYDGVDGIDWIIQGGESGHHKRPFDLAWAYLLRDQCKEAGIPYFFKQIDKIKPIPEDLIIRELPFK